MLLTWLGRLAELAIWILAQGLILNKISIFGYATPMPYLLFLLRFPNHTGQNHLMLWAFATGLLTDLFTSTPGVGIASCVLMAFLTPSLLERFSLKDLQEDSVPSARSMGRWGYVNFLITLTFVHQTVYYSLMAFSFTHVGDMAINIFGGTALTVILMLGLAPLFDKK